MKVRVIALIAALLTVVSSSAEARYHHRHVAHRGHVRVASLPAHEPCVYTDSRTICTGPVERITARGSYETVQGEAVPGHPGWYYDGRVIGGRPSGCPHAFCGCEASIYTFGRIIPELNLAANWPRKFARAAPAPGMAAARSGHVMILVSQVSGLDWNVHDGNSGGHKTREHVRSIAGYTIVDPHSPRYASR